MDATNRWQSWEKDSQTVRPKKDSARAATDIIASDSAIGKIVDERLAQAGAYPREALVSLKKQEVSSALRLSVSPNSWLVGALKTLTQQGGSFAYPPAVLASALVCSEDLVQAALDNVDEVPLEERYPLAASVARLMLVLSR